MNGDVGAKNLIKQYAEKLAQVAFPKGAIDLDTPGQYQQLVSNSIKTI